MEEDKQEAPGLILCKSAVLRDVPWKKSMNIADNN